MTIKLLTPRDLTIGGRTVTYPVGALVTLDAATETGLIASNEATATLTGGITYTPPVPSGQPQPLYAIPSDQGVGKLRAGDATRYFTEVIYSLAADSVGSAGTTPQQLAAVRLPAGGLSIGALLRITIAESKSGTSETMTGGIYIGPNGSNADQLITAAPTLAGTAVAQGGIFAIEITSNTTARGAGALDAKGNLLGTSTSAFAEKIIGDIRSGDNWISIYTTMSGSVEVPTLRVLTVEVIPGTT